MEIFKNQIKFIRWGELYAGLKRQWISKNDVIKFCEENNVKPIDENRLIKLYLAADDLYQFYETIKSFIVEDNDIEIINNEDSVDRDLKYIPVVYWEIWKLEFLLRIKNKPINIERKLEEIVVYFHLFDFPEDWKPFIYYQPQAINTELGVSNLHNHFIKHLNLKVQEFIIYTQLS